MTLRFVALTYVASDPALPARFWAEVLDREVLHHHGGLLLPGTDTQLGLRFLGGEVDRTGPDRVHLHLTTDGAPGAAGADGADGADQQAVVDRVLRAGGRHLDVGQLPEEEHVVLADVDGNALCVIEVGNRYLAGTGFLGELACDGTRDVGRFWSEALGWPLVWDENEETAVQSPAGGTKVAWGGPPVEPLVVPPRQWFELAADDPDAEAERLVGLGATRGDGVLLDPDGNEFVVRAE